MMSYEASWMEGSLVSLDGNTIDLGFEYTPAVMVVWRGLLIALRFK